MSDSVGKISLDLEIQSDINRQVNTVANMIGKNLKASIDNGIKGSLSNIDKVAKSAVSNLSKGVNSGIKNMGQSIKNNMSVLMNNLKKFKMPNMFSVPKSTVTPKVADIFSVTSRGPPMDSSTLESLIQSTSAMLDNTNAKIEQQREKLSQLKEQYNTCFNSNRKNKLEEQILKVESNINKLIATSDKLGFKLNDLDSKFAKAGSGANKAASSIKTIDNAAKKATSSFKSFGNGTKKSNDSLRQHRSNLGIIVRSMFTWGIVFPIVLKGLTAMATAIGQGLMTNQQFANSFNQIKTNMMVGFTPILQAVLPALNVLMSALAKATTYIASFISSIFGKTYQQSYQATQQLIDAKVAMGAYGDSAKKAAKDVRGLASIDEINTLGKTNENIGGANSKVPQLVAPPVDTTAVDRSMKSLVDRIKSYFIGISFQPLINSFNNLKASISPIIDNIGKILKWFMDNILRPLAEWTIEDALPAFFNVLAGAFDILNPLLEIFMGLASWLWDSFLQPIASWTGGIIVDFLNELADVLKSIGSWISEHKTLVEGFLIILGSFGAATLIVKGYFLAISLWGTVTAALTYGLQGLQAAIAFLASPIGIAIVAIGAIIAAGVILYKHWDEIKAKAIEVWDNIKEKFNQFKDWLGNVFVTDWSEKFGVIGNILNGFLATAKGIIDGIKTFFSGLIDFVVGIFTGDWSRAWEGVVNIFSGIFKTLSSVAKAPLNAVISLVNMAIDGLNSLLSFKMPDFLGGGEVGVNIPKIPYLAKGGIIDSPTLAMVGEHGKEAVVPLENNTQGVRELANLLMQYMNLNSGNNSSGDNNGPVNIILKIGETEFARAVCRSLNELGRQNGGEIPLNI